MADNLGDALPDVLPGEDLASGGGTNNAGSEQLADIQTQLTALTLAVYALTGNMAPFYTPDLEFSAATFVRKTFYRAATEIFKVEIIATGEEFPSALMTTPVRIVLGPPASDVPPGYTPQNSVLANLKTESGKVYARAFMGQDDPGQGLPFLSLTGYASGEKAKVWLYVDGREKLWIPSQEFTAI